MEDHLRNLELERASRWQPVWSPSKSKGSGSLTPAQGTRELTNWHGTEAAESFSVGQVGTSVQASDRCFQPSA